MKIIKDMLDRILDNDKAILPVSHKELEQIRIDKAKHDIYRASNTIV